MTTPQPRTAKEKRSIYWLAILTFAFVTPIVQPASSACLVILFVSSLFLRRDVSAAQFLRRGWDVWLYVLIMGIGLLYTDDMIGGLRIIETNLSLLAMPFVFIKIGQFRKKELLELALAFGMGLLAACLFCLFKSTLFYLEGGTTDAFWAYRLTSALKDMLPIYMAYYIIFTITVCLYVLYYGELDLHPIIVYSLIGLLFVVLLLTKATTAFIGLLFSLLYFTLKFVFERDKTGTRTATFIVTLLLLVCLFVANSVESNADPGGRDDYWERFALWESALLASPSIVFGTGTGDSEEALNSYYLEHDMTKFADASFNAHNQFIECLLSLGIPGLSVLILMLGRPLYLAINYQDPLGFLVFFSFIIYGMTEVFLGRFQGVAFFALMHQGFVAYYSNFRTAFIEKPV